MCKSFIKKRCSGTGKKIIWVEMVAFDFKSLVQGTDNLVILPVGTYPCEIYFSSLIFKGPTCRLRIEMVVLNGEHADGKIRDNLFFSHPKSVKCIRHGVYKFYALLQAIGLKELTDTDQLIKQQVLVDLKINTDPKTNDPYNLVTAYKKLEYINPNQEFARPQVENVEL